MKKEKDRMGDKSEICAYNNLNKKSIQGNQG